MWLIGILSLIILVAVITRFLSRNRSSITFAADFDLETLTQAYAAIVKPLAGFSVAAAVFLANLSRVALSPFFVDVMALYLISFMILMSTAIMFATFRVAKLQSLPEGYLQVHSMLFIVCNLNFYLGLSMSWLGLRPLLLSIELTSLANVFTWLLLLTILAGAIRIGAWLRTLLGVKPLASFSIPLVSIAAAIIYGLTLAPRSAIFWPDANPVLSLAVLVFVIGGVSFVVQTMMISNYGQRKFHKRLVRIESGLIVPYLSAAITALSLLWFVIASV